MTDAISPPTHSEQRQPALSDEDAKLAELGYRQKLDRSVGTLASFAIGFATISATTAVFTGFGAGYFTAGAPFVWTLLLAGAVFALWAFIAADLTAKLPLAGYSYQWVSRINGPDLAWFTGFIALMGWVCGMTGVGFILSGYLGGLLGWSMTQTTQILLAIAVVFVCVLINIYGVRFATMVNNIGVSLELVITVGATALVAIIAFSAPENHQPISALFTGGQAGDKDSYMLAWLAAALGPFFGLIGVESGADVAEETKDARRVVPKTMFYALVTSIVIEFLMYVVYVLAIKDPSAVQANSAAPIEEIITQQAGPAVTKVVVAIALTNILACLLANILVATRLTYSMARDNMLPFSHVWRHVSPKSKAPTYAVVGLGFLSTVLLLSALVNEKAFNYIIGIASLLFFFVYILQTIGLLVGYRRGTIPAAEPGTFDLGRFRLPLYVTALSVFLGVAVALLLLPQFATNKWVFLGIVVLAAVWWATGLKSRLSRGDAGADYAKTHGV
ncbi:MULTISPECIES: APC family permease [Mycolicibacterium]|jgi:amino acid transporter|uniref:Amino acid permease-associated region n=2 Tax=Mycolicibacterium TaxID=1866885 RepID=A1TDP2_MYCVP|nr:MULTISPECIES: APC family permease [Mycolicibacterium]ABM15292.1 amino acid permease-associated region [Mycolicibacterium vanbaalenii PYR-1]MCV7128006.1 amino acid permease [Mycolicibacterium vanbaalenii PYR-1]MDN4520988.1 APC family permease [Mycolicibacterium austroafricanum]MDW5610526.1 APC family permease [Mycolicibacterium sp. D5.8-2]PQP47810.1 amino acid permease [Mycolicibacterium austroafricanum]